MLVISGRDRQKERERESLSQWVCVHLCVGCVCVYVCVCVKVRIHFVTWCGLWSKERGIILPFLSQMTPRESPTLATVRVEFCTSATRDVVPVHNKYFFFINHSWNLLLSCHSFTSNFGLQCTVKHRLNTNYEKRKKRRRVKQHKHNYACTHECTCTHTHTINMYKKIHLTPLLHTNKWLKEMIILMGRTIRNLCNGGGGGGRGLFHSHKKQEQFNDDQWKLCLSSYGLWNAWNVWKNVGMIVMFSPIQIIIPFNHLFVWIWL